MPVGRVRSTISDLVDYGIYLPSSTILIHDDVSPYLTHRVLCALHLLDGPGKTIQVVLNSPGGCCYNGLAIYDALRACKAKVVVKGIGLVASMGSVILQAGDERLLTPNATVMLHEGSNNTGPQVMEDAYREGKEGIRLRTRISKILAERMKISPRLFNTRYRHATYLDASDAVRLGLADTVLG